MLKVKLTKHQGIKILCLGAHSDDIEIGCGGTILKLLENYEKIAFYWVVLSSDKIRAQEAQQSARAFLANAAEQTVIIKEFKDGFFPYIGDEIKHFFEVLKRDVNPDLIFTHFRSDLHQDHRLVSDLTWNTFRDHLILEYEIPKYDGDLGAPNIFFHLEDEICRIKIKNILACFKSQYGNQWFTEETFMAMLRLRGIESNSPFQYAEAFYCRKLVIT
jgi:LmbE family N-acetylglucosaminyl deacetylase